MATCNTWEPPFIGDGVGGSSVSEVCTKLWNVWGINEPDATNPQLSGNYCSLERTWGASATEIVQQCEPASTTPGGPGQVVSCGAACTVTMEIKPAEASSEQIGDMGSIAAAFTVAAVLVLCARKLYDLFDKAPHGD